MVSVVAHLPITAVEGHYPNKSDTENNHVAPQSLTHTAASFASFFLTTLVDRPLNAALLA